MDDAVFSNVVIRKDDRVKTLAQVTCRVEMGDKWIPMDSTLLFSRLLVIVQRCPDIEPFFKPFFKYELTAVPSAFFKGASMQKANKELKANAKSSATSDMTDFCFVIDGGWLVHKVK